MNRLIPGRETCPNRDCGKPAWVAAESPLRMFCPHCNLIWHYSDTPMSVYEFCNHDNPVSYRSEYRHHEHMVKRTTS